MEDTKISKIGLLSVTTWPLIKRDQITDISLFKMKLSSSCTGMSSFHYLNKTHRQGFHSHFTNKEIEALKKSGNSPWLELAQVRAGGTRKSTQCHQDSPARVGSVYSFVLRTTGGRGKGLN